MESTNLTCELFPMETKGDQMLDIPIPEIGSKGVFTEELEQELAFGKIDLAVHSAKDMPSELPAEFEIIAYTVREQAHDVLVSYQNNLDLDGNIIIGTSSSRRIALFHHYYPGIRTVSVRGNLQTRLKKLKQGGMDALSLAFAGVHRLGLDSLIKKSLSKRIFIPAVGQGSLAIETSKTLDPKKRDLIRKAINDQSTEYCLLTERAFLSTLQGGCSIPAFAHAQLTANEILVEGGIISLNGQQIVQTSLKGPLSNAYSLGQKLGQKVLQSGGAKILKEIKSELNT